MCAGSPALPQEPAFGLPSTKKDICAFSKSDIDKMIKDVLAQCHLDTDEYSFHCLRRGGEKAQISFFVDGKPKAGSCGKAGINFTILEYANTGHKTQSSIRLSGI
jgi:hypothetical protein